MIQWSLISFVAWNILNIIVFQLKLPDDKLPRADYLDLRNRITSFVHGLLVLFLSGYNTYFAHSQCGESNTRLEEYIMAFSNGYFAYDLVAMAYLGICDRSMLIHHIICISGLTSGLLTTNAADILVGALFLTEISNPAMHFRVILKHLGMRYTKAYETAELTYMCKFFSKL
jgi:TLC domain